MFFATDYTDEHRYLAKHPDKRLAGLNLYFRLENEFIRVHLCNPWQRGLSVAKAQWQKMSAAKKKIICGLEIPKISTYFVLQSAFYG
jgi:hypothetical protein